MIRNLEREDIEQVYVLGNLLNENFSKTIDLYEILNDLFTHVYVFEEEGKIKGFIMFTELMETVDILNLYVSELDRNKKIASNLLDMLFSNMKNTVKTVTLEVRKDNIPAISLYQKFGFEIISIRKNYYKDIDAYLMGRRLEK